MDSIGFIVAVCGFGCNMLNMNTYRKGQDVLVSDYKGVKHLKKVYEDLGQRVLITSKRNFQALQNGLSRILPIAVPRETVTAAGDPPP